MSKSVGIYFPLLSNSFAADIGKSYQCLMEQETFSDEYHLVDSIFELSDKTKKNHGNNSTLFQSNCQT